MKPTRDRSDGSDIRARSDPSTVARDPCASTVTGDSMWQSSPPGSIYDYIKVASFSIGPDGLVDQWSLRAEQIFGIPAERAVGMDPIEAFIDPDLREQGQRKMAEILDGREWTGVVPFRVPDPGEDGLAGGTRRGLCDADADRGGREGPPSASSSTSGPCARSRPTSPPRRRFSANLRSASC